MQSRHKAAAARDGSLPDTPRPRGDGALQQQDHCPRAGVNERPWGAHPSRVQGAKGSTVHHALCLTLLTSSFNLSLSLSLSLQPAKPRMQVSSRMSVVRASAAEGASSNMMDFEELSDIIK